MVACGKIGKRDSKSPLTFVEFGWQQFLDVVNEGCCIYCMLMGVPVLLSVIWLVEIGVVGEELGVCMETFPGSLRKFTDIVKQTSQGYFANCTIHLRLLFLCLPIAYI